MPWNVTLTEAQRDALVDAMDALITEQENGLEGIAQTRRDHTPEEWAEYIETRARSMDRIAEIARAIGDAPANNRATEVASMYREEA